jgi:hypothetical protein
MRQYASDEQHPSAEVDLSDQSVLVASNVKDDMWRYEVRGVEGLFHVCKAGPGRSLGYSVPRVQRVKGVAVLLVEDSKRLVTDRMH